MIHLFRHTANGKLKGKFDIALVVKGKVIVFSNQGYSRKLDALKLMKHFDTLILQDDTVTPSVVYRLSVENYPQKEIAYDLKPSKPHIPSQTKK